MSGYLSQDALEQMPKRPLNGYMLFREDKVEDVKAKNQEKSMTEQASLLGEMWREMSEKQKEPYNKQAGDLKVKYQKDYDAWIKQFKLDKDKVKEALKELKEEKKKKKKGSREQKQKKAKDSEEEEEEEEEEEQKQKKEKKAVKNEKNEKEKNDNKEKKAGKKEAGKKEDKTSKQQQQQQPQKQGGKKKC